mgnify:CR=1 FL=1
MTTANGIQSGDFVSANEADTFDLGVRLGKELTGGEVILLNGPLGAGKTMLVKGVAQAIEIDQEEVTSPVVHPGEPASGPFVALSH